MSGVYFSLCSPYLLYSSNNTVLLGPFHLQGLTLFLPYINNQVRYKVLDEITCPLSYFKGAAIDVLEGISSFIAHFIVDVIIYTYGEYS